jgi:hypothetical protein
MAWEDPAAWAQGAAAFKGIFDGLRAAIGLVRDVSVSAGGSEEQKRLVNDALDKASTAAKIAEAELAKAFGFELCKCEFPPTPMLTVGYHNERGGGRKGPVYECPKCGFNTAGPWMYERIRNRKKLARSP